MAESVSIPTPILYDMIKDWWNKWKWPKDMNAYSYIELQNQVPEPILKIICLLEATDSKGAKFNLVSGLWVSNRTQITQVYEDRSSAGIVEIKGTPVERSMHNIIESLSKPYS